MTRPTRDQALASYLLSMLSGQPQPMFVEALANMLRDARAAGVTSTEYLDSPAQPQGAALAEATPPEPNMAPSADAIDHMRAYFSPPEPPADIIRAAEGMTLEPGEYVDCTFGQGWVPRRLTIATPIKATRGYGSFAWKADGQWTFAVRRVAEPEPVFPEDAFRKFKEGGYMASSREHEPVPESGGDTLDLGPLRILLDRANGTSEYFAGRAVIDRMALERDELRSKVSEAEANSEMDRRSFAECSGELESVRATLAATEAQRDDAPSQRDALWSVRILDAWAETTRHKGYPDGWTCLPWHQGKESYKCCLSGYGGRIFYGRTADAARLLAAETLVSESPTLGSEVPKS